MVELFYNLTWLSCWLLFRLCLISSCGWLDAFSYVWMLPCVFHWNLIVVKNILFLTYCGPLIFVSSCNINNYSLSACEDYLIYFHAKKIWGFLLLRFTIFHTFFLGVWNISFRLEVVILFFLTWARGNLIISWALETMLFKIFGFQDHEQYNWEEC